MRGQIDTGVPVAEMVEGWKADEQDFAMPVRVGNPAAWQLIKPTTEWQTMPWSATPTDFEVATDLYYVYVERQ